MRCLLINPFYPVSETPSPPLGLAYLAAALEQAGIEVRILDYVVYPYSRESLEEALNSFAPALVGITAVTMTFDHAALIARDIKSIDDSVITVMGGPHVSMCAAETLYAVSEIDIVAVGEGEETIVELASAIEAGSPLDSICGIFYRDGGGIISTGPRVKAVDVRTLPLPARHLLPLGRYKALNMPVSMTTSRGCPFKCIFCVGRKMVGSRVRYRDPVSVVDELEYLKGLNFSQVNIADDLFTASRKHCFGVCDEIERRGLELRWSSFARVDLVNYDLLVRMRDAGCVAVSFGVETANPEILKTIRKGITLEQVEAAVSACVKAGVLPHVSFILGLPGETPETIEQTRSFGEKLKNMGASYGFHLLAPFPGTEIRERAKEYGLRILTDDWREYHANRAIVETEWTDSATMDRVAKQWKDEFDEYLGEVKRRMEAGTATHDEAWQLISLENTVINSDLMMSSAIEKDGAWEMESGCGDEKSLVKSLAGRVCGYTDYPAERVEESLRWAMDVGTLGYTVDGNLVKWRWIDHIQASQD